MVNSSKPIKYNVVIGTSSAIIKQIRGERLELRAQNNIITTSAAKI